MQSSSLESREKLGERHFAVVVKPKSQIYKELAKNIISRFITDEIHSVLTYKVALTFFS